MQGRSGRRARVLLGAVFALGLLAAPARGDEASEVAPAEAEKVEAAPASPQASAAVEGEGEAKAVDGRSEQAESEPPQVPQEAVAPAPDAAEASAEAKAVHSIAVLPFATNEEGLKAEALSLAALVAQRIAQRPGARVTGPEEASKALGERLGELRGCVRAECAVEIGRLLEAGHVVQGRLDRLGEHYLVTATLADAKSGAPVARAREEALEEIDFAHVTDRLGDAAADALGLEEANLLDLGFVGAEEPVAHLNLKFGNTIAALKGFDISAFTLRFDIEADYYLRRYLLAYLEAGIAVGRASDQEGEPKGSFSLVPVTLGLKYVLFHQHEVRPYAGLGLGLGLIGDLVEPEERKVSLHFNGLMGIAYVPWRHLGFNLEASMNFDEMRVSGGSSLLFGFSINFGVLTIF